MIMFNKLPYFVYLNNKKYKINVDFRNMIKFEKRIQDRTIDKTEKIIRSLQYFYPFFYNNIYALITKPELYKEACDKMIWFYKCGREQPKRSGKGVPTSQIYDYDYDDEYIYGAFYEKYRIDLSKDRVHWWKFKALMKSLTDDVEFVKIQGYRAYKGDDKNMKELKEFYKIPLPQSEQDRLDALYESLK